MRSLVRCCTFILLGWLSFITHVSGASFQGIGFVTAPGQSAPASQALAVSADGLVAVGISHNAIRWTAATGIVDIGTLPGIDPSYAFGVSPNGGAIVGSAGNFDAAAFSWTQSTGIVALGNPAGYSSSRATGVSSGGAQIVGYSSNDSFFSTSQSFEWTPGGGFTVLPDRAGTTSSRAVGISADGSSIAGFELSSSGYQAVLWKNGSTPISLGSFPLGTSTQAMGISPDGTAVVGWGDNGSSTQHAFLWTSAGGMIGLGPAVANSRALAASNNGAVVVGQWNLPVGDNAFIWDKTNGMRSLQSVLVNAGLGQALAGWKLTEATGISANGNVIVGNGIDPQGHNQGWIVTVPEPSTFILAGVALAIATIRRTKRG